MIILEKKILVIQKLFQQMGLIQVWFMMMDAYTWLFMRENTAMGLKAQVVGARLTVHLLSLNPRQEILARRRQLPVKQMLHPQLYAQRAHPVVVSKKVLWELGHSTPDKIS